MDWNVAIGVTVLVAALGALAAVLWWRLSHKRIPYRDDAPRDHPHPDHDVVIIRDDDLKQGS